MYQPKSEGEIHYLWYHQKFPPALLITKEGYPIHVIDPGAYNENAGPDFLNALVEINGVVWSGSVEIHVKSSDWFKHGHQFDEAYNNVILHVVVEDDAPVEGIPVLLLYNYKNTMPHLPQKVDLRDLPCRTFLNTIPVSLEKSWKNDSLNIKLSSIYHLISDEDKRYPTHFLFRKLFRFFGLYINQDPMEQLSQHLDVRLLMLYQYDLTKLGALLFGIAGFLEDDIKDDYHKELKAHFSHLKRKHPNLGVGMKKSVWKFSRMHPGSFPTIRISQLAHLLHQVEWGAWEYAFNDHKEWTLLMQKVRAHPYWEFHSDFGAEAHRIPVTPGKTFVDRTFLNTVFYYWALKVGSFEAYCSKMRKELQSLPSENNNIIKVFKKEGVRVNNAWDSQAVLAGYKNRCLERGCKQCQIGQFIYYDQNDVQKLG